MKGYAKETQSCIIFTGYFMFISIITNMPLLLYIIFLVFLECSKKGGVNLCQLPFKATQN